MCVTNTTGRRPQPVSFHPAQISICQSLLSYNFLESFAPCSSIPPQGPIVSVDASEQHVLEDKTRPKRRRKPQKPGKTAKNNDRHFVVHRYHDHALDRDCGDYHEDSSADEHQRRRGGVSVAFPNKLHEVLDQVEADGLAHVISWQPHGRCFVIHQAKEFVDYVMPKYFRQTKLTSFQRQLNLYGFNRLTRGDDAGGYYHELFLRGMVFLCKQMIRTKVKGTRFKAASNPEQEPDFYTMPPVAPCQSDSEMSTTSVAPGTEIYSLQPTFSFEPLPLQYVTLQQPQLVPMHCFQPPAQVPYSVSDTVGPAPPDADGVLDEAVDELFFNDEADEDTLGKFCSDWDPAFDNSFEVTLNNDLQLGFMLEKLLED